MPKAVADGFDPYATTRRLLPRRSSADGARAFRRAGVSEREIMTLCGWRTRAMFARYNVIDEADLARAVAKRFGANDTVKRQSAPAGGSEAPLS